MSTLSQFAGGIKSIQRGSILVTGTSSGTEVSNIATVTAVNTAKSVLMHLGDSGSDSIGVETSSRLVLTNSTTVTAYCLPYNTTAQSRVTYQLVEYY